MAPVYDLTVNIPELPEGEEIEVPPFGSVGNGGTIESVSIPEEDVERYENGHGLSLSPVSEAEARRRAEEERRSKEQEDEEAAQRLKTTSAVPPPPVEDTRVETEERLNDPPDSDTDDDEGGDE